MPNILLLIIGLLVVVLAVGLLFGLVASCFRIVLLPFKLAYWLVRSVLGLAILLIGLVLVMPLLGVTLPLVMVYIVVPIAVFAIIFTLIKGKKS